MPLRSYPSFRQTFVPGPTQPMLSQPDWTSLFAEQAEEEGIKEVLAKSLKVGAARTGRGVAGTVLAGLKYVPTLLAKPLSYIAPSWAEKLAGTSQTIQQAEEATIAYLKDREKDWTAHPDTAVEHVVSFLGQTLPSLASYVAAGLTAGPTGVAALSFAVEGQTAYDKAIERGASPDQAHMERLLVGSINAALNSIEVGRLLKFGPKSSEAMKQLRSACQRGVFREIAKSGGKLTAEAFKTGLANGFIEAAQEGVSITVPGIARGDLPKTESGQVDWEQILERLGIGFVGGAVLGTVAAGLNIATRYHAGEGILELPAKVRKLSDVEAEEFPKYKAELEAKAKEMPQLAAKIPETPDEAAQDIAYRARIARQQLGPAAEQIDSKFGPTAAQKVFSLVYDLGGAPEDPAIQKPWLTSLWQMAKTASKWEQKVASWELKGKPVHAIAGWDNFVSARHAIERLSIKSGINLSSDFHALDQIRIRTLNEADNIIRSLVDVIEENNITRPEMVQISKSLLLGTIDKLDDRLRPIAERIADVLATETAYRLRKIQFYRMEEGKYTPPGNDPQTGQPWDVERILQEGRQARSQGPEAFDNWLKTQQWGTRKNYWMSEAVPHLEDVSFGGFSLEAGRVGLAKGATPSAINPRKYEAEIKKGDPLVNLMNHIRRIYVSAEAYPVLKRFVAKANQIELSGRDVNLLSNVIDNYLTRAISRNPIVDFNARLSGRFWRAYFTVKGPIFAALNYMQGLLGTEVTTGTKGIRLLLTARMKKDPALKEALQAFERYLPSEQVSGMMTEEVVRTASANPLRRAVQTVAGAKIVTKIRQAQDRWIDLMSRSDSTARRLTFVTNYLMADKVLKSGAKPEQIIKQLGLGTLTPMTRAKILQMIDQGQYDAAKVAIALERTQQTNFRYERYQRSMIEQEPLGAMIAGVITYPRGLMELVKIHGWDPLAAGIATGDEDTAKSGLKVLGAFATAYAFQSYVESVIFGRRQATLPSILNPALSNVVFGISDVNMALFQTEGKPIKQRVDRVMGVIGRRAEYFFPILAITSNMWEAVGDRRAVSVLQEVQRKLTGYGKPLYADRNLWQKFIHAVTGAFENPKK